MAKVDSECEKCGKEFELRTRPKSDGGVLPKEILCPECYWPDKFKNRREIECATCKTKFESSISYKKYCSAKCMYNRPSPLRMAICPTCKTEFNKPRNTTEYCSNKCRSIAKRKPVEDRFNDNILKLESGCWIPKNRNLYGIQLDGAGGNYSKLNRVAWTLKFGKIEAGMNLFNKCQTKFCANPDHMVCLDPKGATFKTIGRPFKTDKSDPEFMKKCQREFAVKKKEEVPLKYRAHTLYWSIKNSTKRRNIKVDDDITKEFLYELIKQTPNCPCCGKEIDYKNEPNLKLRKDNSPSIDRVINNIYYKRSNLILVCVECNARKRNADSQRLLNIINYIKNFTPFNFIESTARPSKKANITAKACKMRAKRDNLPIDLTLDSKAIQQMIDGIKTCACCNREMAYDNNGKWIDTSASIDKLIPVNGYLKNNVWFICWEDNAIKNDSTLEQLEQLYEWLKKEENKRK